MLYPLTETQESWTESLVQFSSLFCIDSSDLKIQGNLISQVKHYPVVSIKIREEHCTNDSSDIECIANKRTERFLAGQQLFIWANRKRLDLQDYSSATPVIEESFV